MPYHPMLLNDPKIWALRPVDFKVYAALLCYCDPYGLGAYPTNKRLMEQLGMPERTLQTSLTDLENQGIISRAVERSEKGTYRTITVHYCCGLQRASVTLREEGAHKEAPGGAPDQAPHGAHKEAPGGAPDQAPQKNIPIKEQTHKEPAAAEALPPPPPVEEGGLPNVQAGALNTQPVVKIVGPQLGDLRDRFTAAFYGADRAALNYVTQEMVDSGFVAWALDRMAEQAKIGYKRGPIPFFRSMIKDDWRDGWQDVGQLAKAAKADDRKERSERLKKLMV